jgi:anti-sigma factor RsiW
MTQPISDEAFAAEQARHAHWTRHRDQEQPSDPEARVFAHLASLPTPEFPSGFTAQVLRAHHERSRAARGVAARVGAVAALAAAGCIALASPAFAPTTALRLLQALADSHASGALIAMVTLSLLERIARSWRRTHAAT